MSETWCQKAAFLSEGVSTLAFLTKWDPQEAGCLATKAPMASALARTVSRARIGGLSASRIVSPPTVARGAAAFGPPPTRLLSTAVQGGGASRWRGPVTWVSAGVTVAGLYGLYQYQYQKQLNRQKSVGRPELGGPFTLTDIDGKPVSNTDLMGQWVLIYFGFTKCPDICPEEMTKVRAAASSVYSAPFEPRTPGR